jgi:hypothetical protein
MRLLISPVFLIGTMALAVPPARADQPAAWTCVGTKATQMRCIPRTAAPSAVRAWTCDGTIQLKDLRSPATKSTRKTATGQSPEKACDAALSQPAPAAFEPVEYRCACR